MPSAIDLCFLSDLTFPFHGLLRRGMNDAFHAHSFDRGLR
jgi:hypothetical protein